MAAKRLNRETLGEAPLEKRGRLVESGEHDVEAELDDEVEKELREFEELQSGLLTTTSGKGNSKGGVEKDREGENARRSDVELDDLEQETAKARKKPQQQKVRKTSNRSQPPLLREAVPSKSVRTLPESFAEENLCGDDAVKKSGIPENGEQACLDIELLQFLKDSSAADPLLKPPDFTRSNTMTPDSGKSRLELSEVQKAQLLEQVYARAQSLESNSDDDSNDPDFPAPGTRKSRRKARTRRSKSMRSETRKSPQKKQPTDKESLTKSPVVHQNNSRGSNFPNKAKSSEPALPPHRQSPRSRTPQLRSPTSANSKHGGQQTEPRPGPSKPKPPKHPEYLDFLLNMENPEPHKEDRREEQAHSTDSDQSDDVQSTVPENSTHEQQEYCVIERIIQRRFRNSFTTENEKLEMMGTDRPRINSTELHPYMKDYETRTWLAACNEHQRFFCWPCLFFASKMIWSLNCDETPATNFGSELSKHMQSPAHQETIKQFDAFTKKCKFSIVKKLLSNNFEHGTWTDEERETIIVKGRPRPTLDGMPVPNPETNYKAALEKFYDRVKWICGCAKTRRFYCWPCLLFSSQNLWLYGGSTKTLEDAISRHEAKQEHMAACLMLGKREFDLRKEPKGNGEDIEKRRGFLACLVEILCAEKKKINNSEFSSTDFVDTLELMSEYNEKLRFFVDGRTKASKIAAAQVFTAVITDSVEFLIKGGILEELENANFVTLVFDHSSGMSNKAVLSVIARYVDGNAQVHERFVKLLNVGYNTPPTTLADEFFQVITELRCRSTLVGFTYDGYLVRPGDIPEFNEKVQKLCPNAKFFYYTEHNFKTVLKQTLCHVPICRRVLHEVKELATFFENTPGARKGLLDIVTAAEKSDKDGVWRSSNFITTVFIYHAVIVEIMEKICKNSQAWKVKTVVQATGFLDFLKDSTNRFFVTLMARLFSTVEDLSTELRKGAANDVLKPVASRTALKLQKLGRHFEGVVDSACSHLEDIYQEAVRTEMLTLQEPFSNIIRLTVKLVKNRIFGMEAGYIKISKEPPTPNSSNFIKLNSGYLILQNVALPPNIDSTKLSNEIEFFNSTSLAGLTLPEIVTHMIDYKMVHVLPEFFKFLQLALTIPEKPYGSRNPAVHRMSSYIEGKKDPNSTDALIWMEKEYLSNLQKEPDFYRRVTDRVMSVTKKDVFEQFSL